MRQCLSQGFARWVQHALTHSLTHRKNGDAFTHSLTAQAHRKEGDALTHRLTAQAHRKEGDALTHSLIAKAHRKDGGK